MSEPGLFGSAMGKQLIEFFGRILSRVSQILSQCKASRSLTKCRDPKCSYTVSEYDDGGLLAATIVTTSGERVWWDAACQHSSRTSNVLSRHWWPPSVMAPSEMLLTRILTMNNIAQAASRRDRFRSRNWRLSSDLLVKRMLVH